MGHTIMTETQTIPAFAVWGIGLAATVPHIGATERADGPFEQAPISGLGPTLKIARATCAMEPCQTAEVEMRP
jgi:hypothetical protein